ncbi:hypothetical protein ACFL54_05485 [Planctomycetota bacterium]
MDSDNIGEYAADFQELTGDNTSGNLAVHAVGVSQINMIPDTADPTMSKKKGYLFKIFTLRRDASGTTDDDETAWCAIAWPVLLGKTGTTCFAVNETGDIYSFHNYYGSYGGVHCAPTIISLYSTPFQNDSIPGTDDWLLVK